MKTIEEQAREYALSEHHPTGYYMDIQIEEIKEFAYLQGAEDSRIKKNVCFKDKTKVCNLCHECDVDVLNPNY